MQKVSWFHHAFWPPTDGSNYADKGKGSAVGDRVPNSGSRSMTVSSNGSSTTSVDELSLVYQLQKMNGLVKKRRSRAWRDQPAPSKPGQTYQKSYPQSRTNPSTVHSTSPDNSGRSPSRRKDSPRHSRVQASSSHLTLSRSDLQQTSADHCTPQPVLPFGGLHPLDPIILALGPLRLQGRRT